MRVAEIDTPALVVDLERMERNIATMARFFADKPAKLRPHWKTPKCVEVAKLQLAAGAIGITCAKLGEAEALAAGGVRASVLIANQLVGAAKLARLVELARVAARADRRGRLGASRSTRSTRRCGRARRAARRARRGRHRHAPLRNRHARGDRRARAEARASRVGYRGVMGYEGHAVLVADAAKRKELAEAAAHGAARSTSRRCARRGSRPRSSRPAARAPST